MASKFRNVSFIYFMFYYRYMKRFTKVYAKYADVTRIPKSNVPGAVTLTLVRM